MRQEKGANLIRLANALAATAEGLTLDEMASEIGVSRRTAERMRDALDLLIPIDKLDDGPRKRFRISAGMPAFYRAPTATELSELDAAIAALDGSGGTARAEQLRSLREKILAATKMDLQRRIDTDRSALTDASTFRFEAGPRLAVAPAVLYQLQDAIVSTKKVRFDYRTADGRAEERVVAPYGLLYERHFYYLIGPRENQTKPVLWRLDRMKNVSLEEASYCPPDEFNVNEYARRSFGVYQEAPEDIVLRFSPKAAAEARGFVFHENQTVGELDDGSLEVRFRAGGLLELVRHLFTWGDAVEIVSPDRLREMMVEELRIALARHGANPGGADHAN